jgi:hypothetical protein
MFLYSSEGSFNRKLNSYLMQIFYHPMSFFLSARAPSAFTREEETPEDASELDNNRKALAILIKEGLANFNRNSSLRVDPSDIGFRAREQLKQLNDDKNKASLLARVGGSLNDLKNHLIKVFNNRFIDFSRLINIFFNVEFVLNVNLHQVRESYHPIVCGILVFLCKSSPDADDRLEILRLNF